MKQLKDAIMDADSPASADLTDALALLLGSLPGLPLHPRLPPGHRPLLVTLHHLHHWM